MKTAVVLFTRDLRVHDNPALAARRALESWLRTDASATGRLPPGVRDATLID